MRDAKQQENTNQNEKKNQSTEIVHKRQITGL